MGSYTGGKIFSNLKVWALGVYHGLRRKHLQSYLDEFVFRFNRRKTNGDGRIAARTIEGLISSVARPLEDITGNSAPYAAFRS